jgi:hypothetical protein
VCVWCQVCTVDVAAAGSSSLCGCAALLRHGPRRALRSQQSQRIPDVKKKHTLYTCRAFAIVGIICPPS